MTAELDPLVHEFQVSTWPMGAPLREVPEMAERSISVGSEDLYRVSETGVKANAGLGVGPTELVDYIWRM
jgi:hypothetical protein